MKLKPNFVLRQVADTWVIIPIGDATIDFNGVLKLNETGALLWKGLERGLDKNELADMLNAEYEVSNEQALEDAGLFLQKLANYGCIEDLQ